MREMQLGSGSDLVEPKKEIRTRKRGTFETHSILLHGSIMPVNEQAVYTLHFDSFELDFLSSQSARLSLAKCLLSRTRPCGFALSHSVL